MDDASRSGRPSTNVTTNNIERVRQMLLQNRRLSVRWISEELGINKDNISTIIHKDLFEILNLQPPIISSGACCMTAPARILRSACVHLPQRRVTVISNQPYSSDLAPADFSLFPCLKEVLKGTFCTSKDL
ncbi:hypothetical protein AVEN_6983-1 [Araneus ventricosus]|uniref:Uncharacterized protein n=1 Tax=Araneus ventricosus TaxID=182803 RepID=A0A4Y2I483_ARAVE|nr:hypothetical protein AVEN_6983-1 [Araneus ventricosus]